MDHRLIEEHNWVERYVLEQLNAAEQERFEEHFADCGECLEAVELAQELRLGLAEIGPAAESPAIPSATTTAPVFIPSETEPPRAASPLRWLAAAALLLIALLPALRLAQSNRALTDQIERLERPWAATPAVVLEIRRDSASSEPAKPAITVHPDEPWIALAVDLGDLSGLGVDVALRDAEGETLWSAEGLTPPPAGPLVLSLPSMLLATGPYRLDTSLRSADGRVESAGEFSFEVVPPP
ncbi:MAG: hypothetical protein AAF604_19905 [Acidobacteriota bacterium]